jgi:hypothetical protein
MNVEDTNLNDHINLLEIKLEKIYQEKAKGTQLVIMLKHWGFFYIKNEYYFVSNLFKIYLA